MHPIWVAGTPGERAKIELAQDVARFANSDVDAVLVIGYRETGGGDNEIGSLTPVADQYLNPTQIREVLDARIVPPLDGLVVETFRVAPPENVLAVFVPKQPSEMQPYLVHGAIAEDKVEGAFFSIVRRRGEASITTAAQQIHAYIVAGKRYLRGEESDIGRLDLCRQVYRVSDGDPAPFASGVDGRSKQMHRDAGVDSLLDGCLLCDRADALPPERSVPVGRAR